MRFRLALAISLILVAVIAFSGQSSAYNYTTLNLTAYWKFNNNLLDSSPNGYTLVGGNAGSFALGKLNEARKYSTSGGGDNSSSSSDWAFGTAPFTVAFWVNTTTATSDLFRNCDALHNAGCWEFWMTTSNFRMTTSGGDVFTTPMNLGSTSGWQRVVVTRVASNSWIVYINGTQVTTGSQVIDLNYVSTIKFARGLASSRGSFSGAFDDVVIIKGAAWNATDVTDDWNNGNGMEVPTPASTISISLVTPLNNTPFISSSINFNASLSPSFANLTNATIFVYNSTSLFNRTTVNVSGNGFASSFFTVTGFSRNDNYNWSVLACGLNSSAGVLTGGVVCTLSSTNTFVWGYQVIGEYWKNTTTEGSSDTFQLNLSLGSGIQISTANLLWNNTAYSGTFTSIAGSNYSVTRQIAIPDFSSNLNVSFYWNITLDNGLNFITTTRNQSVFVLSIDNCTVNSNTFINYTLFDEDTRTIMNGTLQNTTVEVSLQLYSSASSLAFINFSTSYSRVNPVRVCSSSNIANATGIVMQAVTKYYATQYATEYYVIQNYSLSSTSVPLHIALYPLPTLSSQDFLVTFKDRNKIVVQGALIDLQRQYIPTGEFIRVELPETDTEGRTIIHSIVNDVNYNIYVRKNGELLAFYQNVRFYCVDPNNDCRVNLQEASSTSSPADFRNYQNVTFIPSYNSTTMIYRVPFISLDDVSRNINLTITKFDPAFNNTICSTNLFSSSGTLACAIGTEFGNSSAVATIYIDGVQVYNELFRVNGDRVNDIDYVRILIAALVLAVFVIIGSAASQKMGFVFYIFGLVVIGLLSLLSWGSWTGAAAGLAGFLIAALIIMWISNRRGDA